MPSETLDKSRSDARGSQTGHQAHAAHRPGSGRRAALITGGVFLALALLAAFVAAIWDWNWFRAPLARAASSRLHREVSISGDLHVHLWSWNPTATVDGVHVANPPWAGGAQMADIQRIDVRIRLLPLFRGQLDLRRLEFDEPSVRLWRDRQGRATWDFSNGRNGNQPLRLPPIRNFIIRNGALSVRDDVRKLTFTGTIEARERLGKTTDHGFEMQGHGALNAEPFTLSVIGGPLLNIDRSRPYPFDADIRAGPTYVTARGSLTKPFDFGQFSMAANARGPDLAELYELTGVPLPNTPPYNLHGRLSRNEHVYKIDGLGGRVGSSDLTGTLSVDSGRPRSLLTANLLTRSLDFPDLGALFGGAPKPGKIASPSQKVEAQRLAVEDRIFPDATLDVSRIRRIDADVTYKALSIHDAPVNLAAASTRVKLNDGLLRAEPLTLDLPRGRITGYVQLNARKTTPVTDLDFRLSNARIETFLPLKFQGAAPAVGALVARARLTGMGDSVHRALANADGQVVVVAPGGEIRSSIAELMGVDVIKGLGLLFDKSRQTTPIRCGVGAFQVRNGVMSSNQLVFDTEPVLVTGSGQVNLGTERLHFEVQGHPKKFQLVRLVAPIVVDGPIRGPRLTVEKGNAIAQGGVAVALATLLSPLAAILPFVDAGLAKDANCAGLVAGAVQEGAPVRTAARRAPLTRP